MDFIQTIKAEHAKANDTIDKLGETSDGAVKTRERLSSQLRALLEEHSRKEESYLYPALEQRGEAKDFLQGARQVHEEINRLADELDGMEKSSSDFLPRLNELKKIAHQHMREEERLLPGMRKAMSDEEVRSLDDAFSGEADEAGQDAGESSRGGRGRIAAEQARETVSSALRRGAEVATGSAQHFAERAGDRAERGAQSVLAAAEIYGETAQLTADDLQAIATCSTIAAGGMSEMRHAWMDWLGRTLRVGARASQELLRCTTLEQLADVQRNFFKENLDNLLEGSAQMLRISSRVSGDVLRPIEDRVTRLRRGENRGQAAIAGHHGRS